MNRSTAAAFIAVTGAAALLWNRRLNAGRIALLCFLLPGLFLTACSQPQPVPVNPAEAQKIVFEAVTPNLPDIAPSTVPTSDFAADPPQPSVGTPTDTRRLIPTTTPPSLVVFTPTPTTAPLTTPIPNEAGLTIEENEIVGEIELTPLTFDLVYGSQKMVKARHAQAKQEPYRRVSDLENGVFVVYPMTGGTQYRAARMSEGKNIWVELEGQVIFETTLGDISPIYPVRGLWVGPDHWYLEIAHVKNTIDGNAIYSQATGQVFRDGVLLNEQLGFAEIFGFQMLDGKPFYFYRQDGQIHLSYDNEDLPVVYEEIPHYRCCSAGALNPDAAENWIGFFGQRDGVWYYTEIGRY